MNCKPPGPSKPSVFTDRLVIATAHSAASWWSLSLRGQTSGAGMLERRVAAHLTPRSQAGAEVLSPQPDTILLPPRLCALHPVSLPGAPGPEAILPCTLLPPPVNEIMCRASLIKNEKEKWSNLSPGREEEARLSTLVLGTEDGGSTGRCRLCHSGVASSKCPLLSCVLTPDCCILHRCQASFAGQGVGHSLGHLYHISSLTGMPGPTVAAAGAERQPEEIPRATNV